MSRSKGWPEEETFWVLPNSDLWVQCHVEDFPLTRVLISCPLASSEKEPESPFFFELLQPPEVKVNEKSLGCDLVPPWIPDRIQIFGGSRDDGGVPGLLAIDRAFHAPVSIFVACLAPRWNYSWGVLVHNPEEGGDLQFLIRSKRLRSWEWGRRDLTRAWRNGYVFLFCCFRNKPDPSSLSKSLNFCEDEFAILHPCKFITSECRSRW